LNLVPLVETTRGVDLESATVENVHHGAIAVVDTDGRVLLHAGDPYFQTFTRSALKPFQALPLVLDDGLSQLGFTLPDLALFCASHSGEPCHTERIAAILASLSLTEEDLQCGCHVPTYYATVGERPPPGARFTQLHHNCSGKHTGMLAWCRLHGASHADYLAHAHPLQTRIRDALLPTFGGLAAQFAEGIDGCSAPNFAMPLASLAHFYARVAMDAGEGAEGAAFRQIFDAMTGYPELVSGVGRTDLAYMSGAPGDWISKAGADGVQVLASRERGIGIAIKIADGTPRALHTAMVATLEATGLATDKSRAKTEPWRAPEIRNYKGLAVGSIRPRVVLTAVK
jgi:L-asparaginase II